MDFGHEGHQNYHLDIEETRWRYEESSPPVLNVLGGLAAGAMSLDRRIASPRDRPLYVPQSTSGEGTYSPLVLVSVYFESR